MGEKKKLSEYLVVAFFSLVAIIGVGVGMYYLGLEKGKASVSCGMDCEISDLPEEEVFDDEIPPKPEEPSPIVTIPPPNGWYTYQNTELQIRFLYPDGWVVTEKRGNDTEYINNIKEIYVTAPSGTRFIYYSAEIDGIGVEGGCNPNNPSGDGDMTYSCVFVDESVGDFARYRPRESSVEKGEWLIAERTSEDFYASWPSSSFTYEVKDSTELTILDKIMGSVERM